MHIDEDDDEDAEQWSSQRADSSNEDPDARDIAVEDDIKCVHCGRYIHADVDICPHCRMWQSDEVGRTRKPRWFVLTVILCVTAISGALAISVALMYGWHL